MVAKRLREARVAAGYRTAKEFADKNGIPQSTFALHEKGRRGLTRDVAIAYANDLKINLDWLLTGKHSTLTNHIPTSARTSDLQPVMVVGDVEAGVWREAIRWPQDSWKQIQIPMDERYLGLQRFGLEVRGPSMDRIYPPGTIVVCVNLIDLGRDPRSGERVICYLRARDGTIEATVKEYVVLEDGSRWLWPRSYHPDFQSPLKMPVVESDDDNEDVRVVALVTGSYRPE